jgi:hypothetical protein
VKQHAASCWKSRKAEERALRYLPDKARHGKMVELVDRMRELNKQKRSGKLAPSQVERVGRESPPPTLESRTSFTSFMALWTRRNPRSYVGWHACWTIQDRLT